MNKPYRQLDILQQALESDKSLIAFLLGAGCPASISIQCEEKTTPLIDTIEGLTKQICENTSCKSIDKIIARISSANASSANIEDILSHVRLLIEVVLESNIDGLTKKMLEDLEIAICEEITNAVNKELPSNETPYHYLASWIRGIPRTNPVEIFTPNYDLLMESALETRNVPYFDGFIGSKRAFFDLHSIEHEKLPSRWARLWKLHGSINWWRDPSGKIFRGHSQFAGNKQMIYPSHLKYEESRRMPFYAMQDRLGHFLATGQAVLVTCGYSFIDKHLNAIILERLSANPRAICFGLLYSDLENYPGALACAKETSNLSLIASDGAFVGGQKVVWGDAESGMADHYKDYLDKEIGEEKHPSKIKCKIGDFQILGKFLLNQLGYTHNREED
ncbi:MAG: SIR2 family protein [Desulfobulbaceae bacterium]